MGGFVGAYITNIYKGKESILTGVYTMLIIVFFISILFLFYKMTLIGIFFIESIKEGYSHLGDVIFDGWMFLYNLGGGNTLNSNDMRDILVSTIFRICKISFFTGLGAEIERRLRNKHN